MPSLKVVVTGASGFLGAYVLRSLAARENVETIAVTTQEIPGWLRVSDYSQSPTGDVLIHLAEENNRSRVAELGQAYEQKTLTTLDALLTKSYGRIVYASSSVLYGDADGHAHFPDDPIHDIDAYTRVKRKSELAVLALPTGIVARLANIYGPGMSQDNVMSAILRQIPGAGALEVWDTTPVRDFLWVEDAAEGIVDLALCSARGAEERRIYNLSAGVGVSIKDLAELALKIGRQPERPVTARHKPIRQSRLILDCSGTRSACGWQPQTSLKQGLSRLLKVLEKEYE